MVYCSVLQQMMHIEVLMCALLFSKSLQEKLKIERRVVLSCLEQFQKSPGMSRLWEWSGWCMLDLNNIISVWEQSERTMFFQLMRK